MCLSFSQSVGRSVGRPVRPFVRSFARRRDSVRMYYARRSSSASSPTNNVTKGSRYTIFAALGAAFLPGRPGTDALAEKTGSFYWSRYLRAGFSSGQRGAARRAVIYASSNRLLIYDRFPHVLFPARDSSKNQTEIHILLCE